MSYSNSISCQVSHHYLLLSMTNVLIIRALSLSLHFIVVYSLIISHTFLILFSYFLHTFLILFSNFSCAGWWARSHHSIHIWHLCGLAGWNKILQHFISFHISDVKRIISYFRDMGHLPNHTICAINPLINICMGIWFVRIYPYRGWSKIRTPSRAKIWSSLWKIDYCIFK